SALWALAPGLAVVAPVIIAARRGSQGTGDFHGVFGDDCQRAPGMHAAIAVRPAFPLVVHAKEFGVLREQRPRQQFPHRMEFIFDRETEPRTLLEKSLAGV